MENNTTNNIVHIVDINNAKANCKIEISLNDECKNGHEDFHITAMFWEKGKARNEKNWISGGCCHEEILQLKPEFKIFVQLHGNHYSGYDSAHFSNAHYFYREMTKERFIEKYMLDEKEYEYLQLANNEDEFAYLMIKINNHLKWESLAKKGINEIEKLSGKKFKSTATKPFDIAKYKALSFPEDWFLTKNISDRKNKNISDKKEKARLDLIETAKKDIEKIKLVLNIKMQFLKMGYIKFDNVIIYDHIKTVTLNWSNPNYSTYNYKFTQEEYEKISKKLKLLKDWTVEIKQIY